MRLLGGIVGVREKTKSNNAAAQPMGWDWRSYAEWNDYAFDPTLSAAK